MEYVAFAAVIVRRSVIGKGFDENFFMYVEDTELCKRIRRKGYKIVYYPATAGILNIDSLHCSISESIILD